MRDDGRDLVELSPRQGARANDPFETNEGDLFLTDFKVYLGVTDVRVQAVLHRCRE